MSHFSSLLDVMFCVVHNNRKTSNIKYHWFVHVLVCIYNYSFILSFVSLFSPRCKKFFLSSCRLFFCPPSPLHFFDLFANLFHSLLPCSVISPLPFSYCSCFPFLCFALCDHLHVFPIQPPSLFSSHHLFLPSVSPLVHHLPVAM